MMSKTISIENDDIAVSVDISAIVHISDIVPVLKAVLVVLGYHMKNVDDLFDEDYKELEDAWH